MSAPPTPLRVLVLGHDTAGSSILTGLARRPSDFHTAVLVRQESAATKAHTLEPLKAQGVEVVLGDLKADEAELVRLFAGYHCLVSCVTHERTGTDELRVARAAQRAGVQRYLPTAFGIDYLALGKGSPMGPIIDARIDRFHALTQSGIAWTNVGCGYWAEWLLGPGRLLQLDWQQRTMTAVDTFDAYVSSTSLLDLGDLVAQVLLDPHTLNAHVHLHSMRVSLGDIADALDRVTGQKWKREVKPLAEALAHNAANPHDWKWTSRILIAQQKGVTWPVEHSYNHQHPTPSHLHTLQDVVEAAAKENGQTKTAAH